MYREIDDEPEYYNLRSTQNIKSTNSREKQAKLQDGYLWITPRVPFMVRVASGSRAETMARRELLYRVMVEYLMSVDEDVDSRPIHSGHRDSKKTHRYVGILLK